MIDQHNNSLNFLTDFLIAIASSSVPKTFNAPIQFAQIRITMMNRMIHEGAINKPYNGIFNCIKRVATQEGFLKLWKGNGKNLLRYVPNQGLIFAFRGLYSRILEKKTQNYKFLDRLIKNVVIGGTAGISSLIFVYPVDFVNNKLLEQQQNRYFKKKEPLYTGRLDAIKKVFTHQGVSGFYKNFGISFFGVFVYRSLYFGIFDTIKPIIPSNYRDSLFMNFLLGWSSTTLALWTSSPIDTVRRRRIISPKEYSSYIDCAKKIYAQQGLRSFFRNTGITRSFAGGVILSVYQKLSVTIYKKYQ